MYIQFYSCTVSNFAIPLYGAQIPAHCPCVYCHWTKKVRSEVRIAWSDFMYFYTAWKWLNTFFDTVLWKYIFSDPDTLIFRGQITGIVNLRRQSSVFSFLLLSSESVISLFILSSSFLNQNTFGFEKCKIYLCSQKVIN